MSKCIVRINDIPFEVRYALQGEIPGDDLGETIYAKQLILLAENQQPECLRRTVVHEIVYATMWAFGYSSFNNFNREQICEFVANCMSPGMLNPDDIIQKLKESENQKAMYDLCLVKHTA